jgi:hypothetical protein
MDAISAYVKEYRTKVFDSAPENVFDVATIIARKYVDIFERILHHS